MKNDCPFHKLPPLFFSLSSFCLFFENNEQISAKDDDQQKEARNNTARSDTNSITIGGTY